MNNSRDIISDNSKVLQPHQICPDITHAVVQHSYLIFFGSYGNVNKLSRVTITPHVTLAPLLLSDLPSRLCRTYPQQPFSI